MDRPGRWCPPHPQDDHHDTGTDPQDRFTGFDPSQHLGMADGVGWGWASVG